MKTFQREKLDSSLSWNEYKSMAYTLQDCKSNEMSKNFMPFREGMKQCAGAEYTRKQLCIQSSLHMFGVKNCRFSYLIVMRNEGSEIVY
ncbi:hypothetical protein CFP56_022586 [Quercus suber]|uniref:Uncharacterized protein n=1 Tax=Quercus suber TaxID=58331 RepID=A0AAW0LZ32_QUESU